MCTALAAASTQRISPDAYNSSDAGWTNVFGEDKSVRLHGTMRAFDELCHATQRISAPSVEALLKRANAVFNRYAEMLAKRRAHSDDVIEYMLDTLPHLFEASHGESTAVVATAKEEPYLDSGEGVKTPETAKEPRGGPQKGVCPSWVLNGNCRREDCTYTHPARARASRRPNQRGSGGGNWFGGGWNGGGGGWHE